MPELVSAQCEPLPPHQETLPKYERLTGSFDRMMSSLSGKERASQILAGVILFSLSFCAGLALTRRPWCDEAWFASPAYNLDHHGFMGMTVLDPHGFPFYPYVPGIDRYTFWVMPAYILLQAAWYKIVGLSLFSMRAISIFWGGTALLSWYLVVRRLTGDHRIALLATFLLGTEQHFVRSASTGRMDMMCAALGLLSLALYIGLRRRFTLALFVASCVSALNLFTHPNAAFGMVALAVTVLYFDREHITIRALLLALCPFLVLASLWGLYIAQAPHLFLAQFHAQRAIPHRLEVPWNPFKAFGQELALRYGTPYGLTSGFPMAFESIIVAQYFGAIIIALRVSELRRNSGVRVLLIIAAIAFTVLMCIQKNWYYLIFIIPYYTAIVAIVFAWLWRKSLGYRAATIAFLAIVTALNLGIVSARILHDDYKHRFLEATTFLKHSSKPGDLIMGSGELAFQLGFDGQVLDDSRLGYSSGKTPEFIVIDGQYANYWLPWFSVYEPATYQYIQDLFTNKYEIIHDEKHDRYPTYGVSDRPYQILQRKTNMAR
jgi:4-amino-4-deoxy-L-arabinose transferase-like glycosyltransferase